MLKLAFLFLSVLLQAPALAQQARTNIDGTWLKDGLDAYERAFVSRRGGQEDVDRALALSYFVAGVVSAGRHTTYRASLVSLANERAKQSAEASAPSNACDQGKVLRWLAPLAGLPESLTPQQVNAVLQRYLAANPEKWGADAAGLVVSALAEAFPVR